MEFLSGSQRAKSLDVIEQRLVHQPRAGNIRIFYEVVEDQNLVRILAIGLKIRDTLWIAGARIKL